MEVILFSLASKLPKDKQFQEKLMNFSNYHIINYFGIIFHGSIFFNYNLPFKNTSKETKLKEKNPAEKSNLSIKKFFLNFRK